MYSGYDCPYKSTFCILVQEVAEKLSRTTTLYCTEEPISRWRLSRLCPNVSRKNGPHSWAGCTYNAGRHPDSNICTMLVKNSQRTPAHRNFFINIPNPWLPIQTYRNISKCHNLNSKVWIKILLPRNFQCDPFCVLMWIVFHEWLPRVSNIYYTTFKHTT